MRTFLKNALMLGAAMALLAWVAMWMLASTPCKPLEHSNVIQEWIDCKPET